MENLAAINKCLSSPNGLISAQSAIITAATEFIRSFEKSESKLGDGIDEIRLILTALRGNCPGSIELLFATILKILLRKPVNRDALGKFGFNCIVCCISRQPLFGSLSAAELGNVILNACYESDLNNNTHIFLAEGGLSPVLALLKSNEVALQASMLGALQGICFNTSGKYALRSNREALLLIVKYLRSPETSVRARAIGTIHNVTTDPISVVNLRGYLESDGVLGVNDEVVSRQRGLLTSSSLSALEIPKDISILDTEGFIAILVTLLGDKSPDIVHATTGTLQNLSRDEVFRRKVLSSDFCNNNAVERLVELLFAKDVKCQVAAVGALVNIVGPTLNEEISKDKEDSEARSEIVTSKQIQFRTLLSDAITLGFINNCIFEDNV